MIKNEAAKNPLMTAQTAAGDLMLRSATSTDLPRIIQLLADDELGATRETTVDAGPYRKAFAAIDSDPAHLLMVGELNGETVATFQLSFIPGLSHRGALRAQIEGVRVSGRARGLGVGTIAIQWAVDFAREQGCTLAQLTTDKTRTAAHRFYERLGFVRTHEGMKLTLRTADPA